MTRHRARGRGGWPRLGSASAAVVLAAVLLLLARSGTAALALSDLRVEPSPVEAYSRMVAHLGFSGAESPIARLWVQLSREGQPSEPAPIELRAGAASGPTGRLWFGWEMGAPGAYRLSVTAEETGGGRSLPLVLPVLVQEPSRPYEVITYPSEGLRIKGYLYQPLGPKGAPAIVFSHGSRRREELPRPVRFEWLGYRLARLGYVVLAAERRGYGGSEGQGVVGGEGLASLRAGLPGEIKDVATAVGYLAARPEVDPGRIALVGKSLGGMVSLLTAAEVPRVRAVASLAGGYGFGDRTTGTAVFYVEQSLRDAARRLTAPTLLLHAENDRVVPVALSRTLHRDLAVRSVPVTLKEYPPFRIGGKEVDGHRLFDGVTGLGVFWRDLTDFLGDALGMNARLQ